jgi:hypothetical protein
MTVGRRVFAIALGYEDLVDHDELRGDPTMAVLVDKLASQPAGFAHAPPRSSTLQVPNCQKAPPGDLAPGYRFRRLLKPLVLGVATDNGARRVPALPPCRSASFIAPDDSYRSSFAHSSISPRLASGLV